MYLITLIESIGRARLCPSRRMRASKARTEPRPPMWLYLILLVLFGTSFAQSPATQPIGKFPHLTVDVKNKQIRVDCEALAVDMPLEFYCCVTGTNEHE